MAQENWDELREDMIQESALTGKMHSTLASGIAEAEASSAIAAHANAAWQALSFAIERAVKVAVKTGDDKGDPKIKELVYLMQSAAAQEWASLQNALHASNHLLGKA